MIFDGSRARVARLLAIVGILCAAVTLVTYLEFNAWFFNNELPAYIRYGVIGQDEAAAREMFYNAARDACSVYHPNMVRNCELYQQGLLLTGPLTRPLAGAAGASLTALAPSYGLMPALKISMIGLGLGGALLVAFLITPFLQRLDTAELAAIALAWVGGWIATRLLYVPVFYGAVLQVLAVSVVVSIVLGVITYRSSLSIRSRIWEYAAKPKVGAVLSNLFSALAILACFAVGYWIHRRSPFLYLLAGLVLWPLLHSAVPRLGPWVSGLLAGAVYVATAAIPFVYEIYEPKGQQSSLLSILIFVAICRDDARIFWALPLLLAFDLQNAARLCALIIVAEGMIVFFRGRNMTVIVPSLLTLSASALILYLGNSYPQADSLFDVIAVAAVFMSPSALIAMLAALALTHAAAARQSETSGAIKIDRLLIYAASVVIMAGLSIAARSQVFGAFHLSDLFRAAAPAPSLAIIAATFALFVSSARKEVNVFSKRNAIIASFMLLLLMSSVGGRRIGFTQAADGVRATFTSHLPRDWLGLMPKMTLDDNIVYLDGTNLMSSPIMQYSVIKIILLSRNAQHPKEKPVIVVFKETPVK